MTKRRNYIRELNEAGWDGQLPEGEKLSLEELRILILHLLPEIRSRVQVGIGKGNQTLRMIDLLMGSAKVAYGSQEIIEHLDSEIEALRARVEEIDGGLPQQKDDDE